MRLRPNPADLVEKSDFVAAILEGQRVRDNSGSYNQRLLHAPRHLARPGFIHQCSPYSSFTVGSSEFVSFSPALSLPPSSPFFIPSPHPLMWTWNRGRQHFSRSAGSICSITWMSVYGCCYQVNVCRKQRCGSRWRMRSAHRLKPKSSLRWCLTFAPELTARSPR